MQKFKNVFVSLIVICMLFSFNVLAGTTTTIELSKNQVWKTLPSTSRSGSYSYANARCRSVYPVSGGTDNFTYIQTKLTASGTTISDTYTLSEEAAVWTRVKIYEGYLNKTSIAFNFRGNNPKYAANATVWYDPM